MLELITDLEIDIACLIDCPEYITLEELYDIQNKLMRLHNEYLLSSTKP